MGEQPHLIKSAHWVEILSCCFGTGNVVWGAAIIAISIDIRDLVGNQCLLSMLLFYHQMSIFLVNCNNGCQLHPCQFKSASVWSVACKKEFNWKINCDLSARKFIMGPLWLFMILALFSWPGCSICPLLDTICHIYVDKMMNKQCDGGVAVLMVKHGSWWLGSVIFEDLRIHFWSQWGGIDLILCYF